MMKRNLLIDEQPDYIRTAVTEDGVLTELQLEKQTGEDQTESLFFGRVQSIRPSVGAAFIDIGSELNAFLPIADGTSVRCGDMVIVQGAAKQANDAKGLRVTDKINLAGKWLVLLPGGSDVRISKKIKDPSLRAELAQLGARICPTECGLIIRTVSGDASEELLAQEAASLYALWQAVLAKSSGMTRPGVLHRQERLDMRLIRDLRELTTIVTNSESSYLRLLNEQKAQRIPAQTQIELLDETDGLIFDAFGIEPQIDKALKKRVWLPCGGYLIIDPCEAMTVIDVNSGKMTLGKSVEETALRVNLEAADEIARQLRLRDVSGIIVVDFIDMADEAHRRMLLERMRKAAAADRSQIKVEGLTRLGLMEITRKRVHAQLRKVLCGGCSYCSGTGEVLLPQETARRALRQVQRKLLSGQRGPFVIRCAPDAAQALAAMHEPLGAQVYAAAAPGRHAERFEIEQVGEGMSVPGGAVRLQQQDAISTEIS